MLINVLATFLLLAHNQVSQGCLYNKSSMLTWVIGHQRWTISLHEHCGTYYLYQRHSCFAWIYACALGPVTLGLVYIFQAKHSCLWCKYYICIVYLIWLNNHSSPSCVKRHQPLPVFNNNFNKKMQNQRLARINQTKEWLLAIKKLVKTLHQIPTMKLLPWSSWMLHFSLHRTSSNE